MPSQIKAYEDWLKEVDKQVQALAGCGLDDLADCLTHDWFEDGMSPKTAAKRAIRNDSGGD